jgi:hypothetical protein
MKRKHIFIASIIILTIGIFSIARYSHLRAEIIARNIKCSQFSITCPLKIVPRTIWEIITDQPGFVLRAHVPARFAPTNMITPCNQSATTTPCSVLEAMQRATSFSSPIQITATEPFKFGKLVHTYTDNVSGFSFQYPDELILIERSDVCPYLMTSPDDKSALLTIITPTCSPLSKLASLDEYKKDYIENGADDVKTSFHLLSSDTFKTQSGIDGLHQKFSARIEFKLSTEIHTFGQNRYIFRLPTKGFVIFKGQEYSISDEYYSSLKQAIIGSLTYK